MGLTRGGAGRLARLMIVLGVLSAGAGYGGQVAGLAAAPSSGTVTAPATTGVVRVTWHGTIAPGAHTAPTGGGLRCAPGTGNSIGLDEFDLHVAGTGGTYYNTRSALLKITVEWNPSTTADTNQLRLDAAYDHGSGPDASTYQGAGGKPGQTSISASFENPPLLTGNSHVFIGVCPGYNATPQDYTGTATLTVQSQPLSASTVSPTHPAHHDFGPVVGAQGSVVNVVATGIGFADSTTQCPPNVCDSFILKVTYPGARTQFLRDHKVTIHFHYTWPGAGQDLDVFTTDPGNVVSGPGSPDTANPNAGYEDLDLTNPLSGDWTVRSVAGNVTTPTAAQVDVTMTAVAIARAALAPEPAPKPGAPSFTNYMSPDTAPWTTAGANEPGLGVDLKTGAVMYKDAQFTARINFDDTRTPGTAKWSEVTPPVQQLVNLATGSLDPILWTDRSTGRTIVSDLQTDCSASSYSDDDGATWTPGTGCGIPAGPDHQTIGGGPYPAGSNLATPAYPNALYYCSQSTVNASCALSNTGGLTFGPAVSIYSTKDCVGLHGHVKVGRDGTVYVPNKSCTDLRAPSAVVSEDGGATWSVRPIPEAANPDAAPIVTVGPVGDQIHTYDFSVGHDPSIATALDDDTIYEGFVAHHGQTIPGNSTATSRPSIAVSHDHGRTWSHPVDVGAQLGVVNSDFSAVIAGDHGRAAFAFIGTRTKGVTYEPSFTGDWYLYMSFTSDGGRTWNTVNATPGDPVQRGCVWNVGDPTGTFTNCRNMLDFNDIALDRQGRVLAAYTDGCTGTCDRDPAQPAYTAKAALVRQNAGQSIVTACGQSFTTGCATPALQGRVVSGTIPNTAAPRPVGIWALAVAGVVALGALGARRRRRRGAR